MNPGSLSFDSPRVVTPDDLKIAAQELPPSPQVFGKLGKLLRDPNTSLNDITELVNTDSSLTARVLRLSNSAAFAQDLSIDNLDDAINRIGFREVFKLVGMAAASDLFNVQNKTYQITGTRLWENSVACGLCMDYLARRLGYDEQDMYTLGLLRSMGKMAIDICVAKKGANLQYPLDSAPPLLDWESSSLGVTNPSAASFLLASWNFSEATVDAIQAQYFLDPNEERSTEVKLLNLSGLLVERLEKGLPGESCYWESIDAHGAYFNLQEDDFEEAMESVTGRLDNILTAINA